jgi:exodeoxyribonuclease V beta subunit
LTRETGELRCDFDPGRIGELVRALPPPPGEVFVEDFADELSERGLHHNSIRSLTSRLEELLEAAERFRSGAPPYFCETLDMPGLLAAIADLDDRSTTSEAYFRRVPFDGPRTSLYRRIIESSVAPEVACLRAFAPEIKEVLGEEKRRRGVMTYDDMLAFVWEALEGPQGGELAERLREQYRVGLVDEFQDTDELQWKILRRIFLEGTDDNRLFVVGDPKQAIYGFRGADIHTYFAARDEMAPTRKHPRRVELADNYRSTPAMLGALEAVFGSQFFTGRNEYGSSVESGRPEFRAEWANGERVTPLQLLEVAPNEDGEPMSVEEARETYAAGCAGEIERLLEGGGFQMRDPEQDVDRGLEPGGLHVLARRRRDGERVARKLRERGVACAFDRREGLFETDEARHVATLLEAVAEPRDRGLRRQACLTPFFDIELADLYEVRRFAETASPMRELLGWWELAENRQFGKLASAIISESGILRRKLFAGESTRELTTYRRIFDRLVERAGEAYADIDQMVRYLEERIAGRGSEKRGLGGGRPGGDRNVVQIMTIHQAKGLEADVVFVVPSFNGAARDSPVSVLHDEDGGRIVHLGELGPERRRRLEAERRQSAERLLYVALTRARVRAYLPFVRPVDGEYPLTREPGGTFAVAQRALEPLVGENGSGSDHLELRRPAER